MTIPREQQRARLLSIARRALLERGLEPALPASALAEAKSFAPDTSHGTADLRDFRELAWCSIDNDDSRDLDQLTFAESLDHGGTRILLAVADVSASVAPGSALDAHARANTTSVYTPGHNFPMLPDQLSTDLPSLGMGEERLAGGVSRGA